MRQAGTMAYFSKWRTHKAVAEQGTVDVSERDGVRLLHLGSDTVQSAMRLAVPNKLELAYTRAMMAFLLFRPEPANILMIGLGGGSLAKFVYHYLPGTRCTAVEINPRVVAVARSHFGLPTPDRRFLVEVGDGAEYVRAHPSCADVLMVDGFDAHSQVEDLASQEFYDDCAAALTDNGVLVANLWGSDRRFDAYRQRVETSFEGRALAMPTVKHSNIVLLAFRRNQGSPPWRELRERAKLLEKRHGLEFPRFVEDLRCLNLHTEKRLLI